jgi:hypothetical protein
MIKLKLSDKVDGWEGIIALVLLVIIVLVASWGLTNLIVWLIFLCFGWEFSLLVGTGIWLVLLLIKSVLPSNVKS